MIIELLIEYWLSRYSSKEVGCNLVKVQPYRAGPLPGMGLFQVNPSSGYVSTSVARSLSTDSHWNPSWLVIRQHNRTTFLTTIMNGQ